MKVLVIGRGGREHALAWAFHKSPNVTEVITAPGSDGMDSVARCVPIAEDDHAGITALALDEGIGLAVIGPEAPLVAGLADRLQKTDVPVFGPTAAAAQVEGSKEFAKTIMKKYAIPTADYEVFHSLERAKAYVAEKGAPIVIKADGLAAGKGVVVAQTEAQANEALGQMLDSKQFGEAGARVVIEECLEGEECSLMAFVHGTTVVPMVTAQDHKRAFDGDEGPNTGGMGAYSPVPHMSRTAIADAEENILRKMAEALAAEGMPFTGFLYAGLMMTGDGPKVIEFNARFGDPEAQVILPRLITPLDEMITAVMSGEERKAEWSSDSCIGVVLASDGYPASYEKGTALDSRLTDGEGKLPFFHAGTKKTPAGWVTGGGRVGLVAAMSPDLDEARRMVYNQISSVRTDGLFYRTDIGARAVTAARAHGPR
ncbi:phosphoribosylamine--glycine ligase [Alteribacter natronophilus]|uniref:phosphoribosylamine--glycine ligase n=1 Tax=Alteribacter natronophilus TaxID=2583810 RepID=UPI00110D6D8E|nr:phosphoribosylamine--glycine ligase [Alteribacter natronophilus]TMW71108.1 phosphoribosylamine--glycine ligase [Alteribacter natronophilus]